MENITAELIDSKKIWEEFVLRHPEANFLQSSYWGDFHERLGKSVQRTGFYKKKTLAGVMLSVVEPARRGRYLTIAGGPIINWEDKELVKAAFAQMKIIAKKQKCVFVRIRPQLIESESAKLIFKENNCKIAPMHLTADLTEQLDVAKTEEELIAQMRKTTRYEIRKAEKLGITVESSTDFSQIKAFYDLELETAKRQKFVPFSYKFLSEQFAIFASAGKALLYTSKFENNILAQAFIIFYGNEAVYHYGVSTEEGRKYPGAYLIQWEAIKEAKRRGIKCYNFWGVAPIDNKNHRFYGVSVFKRGFGGEDVQYLHAQDLIINNQRYLINLAIEKLRKIIRRV